MSFTGTIGKDMGALNRIKGIMLNPAAEWDAVAGEMPGTAVLLRNFLLPLALLAPMATIIGMLVFDTRWNAEYGYALLRDRAPVIAVATYAFEIASVYLLALVFHLLARSEGHAPGFLSSFQVATLGSIPLLLSGAMLVIPFNVIFSMMAMLYSFYLYYLGVVRLLGIRPPDATMLVGVAMFCMILLSGFMGALASMLGIY
ncbi:MAG: YIP1 family protein [Betaproteobacteria bacterium]